MRIKETLGAVLCVMALCDLSAATARASSNFGTAGIQFDRVTRVAFTLDPYSIGGVAFQLQVNDVTGLAANWGATQDAVQTSVAGTVVATLFNVPAGPIDPALLGTSATFDFQPGHVYTLSAHFIPSDRGFVYAYSTNALNGFDNPYAGVAGSTQYVLFFAEGVAPVGPVAANSNWQSWQSANLASGPATVLLAVPGDPQQYYAGFTATQLCVPLTACPAGLDCGTLSDGCGGTLVCGSAGGTCSSGLQCGGGGTANVCGCTAFAQLGLATQTIKGDVNCAAGYPPAGSVVEGNLNVPKGANCSLVGVMVKGNVQVQGGSLSVQSSAIGGNLQAEDAGRATVDACTVINGNFQTQNTAGVGVAGIIRGNVQVQSTSGALPGGNWICSSTIGGNLQLQQSAASASFDVGSSVHCAAGNTINGNAQIQQNLGAVSVDDNTVGGNLQCQQNTTISAAANKVAHDNQGQCAP